MFQVLRGIFLSPDFSLLIRQPFVDTEYTAGHLNSYKLLVGGTERIQILQWLLPLTDRLSSQRLPMKQETVIDLNLNPHNSKKKENTEIQAIGHLFLLCLVIKVISC